MLKKNEKKEKEMELVPSPNQKRQGIIFNDSIKVGEALYFKSDENNNVHISGGRGNNVYTNIYKSRTNDIINLLNGKGEEFKMLCNLDDDNTDNGIKYLDRKDEVAINAHIREFYKEMYDMIFSIIDEFLTELLSSIVGYNVSVIDLIESDICINLIDYISDIGFKISLNKLNICDSYELLYNIKNQFLIIISSNLYSNTRNIIYDMNIDTIRKNLYNLIGISESDAPKMGSKMTELINSKKHDDIYNAIQNEINHTLRKIDAGLQTIIGYYMVNLKNTFVEYSNPKFKGIINIDQ